MCTVIVHVPADPAAPVRLLAVRDEDPARSWDPLGRWWPELPDVTGVRDRRAGGAWLAADAGAGRVAVILNRADVLPADGAGHAEPPRSRGRIVLDAVAGEGPVAPPHAQGFNLVEVTRAGATVTMWDGTDLRRVGLTPGILLGEALQTLLGWGSVLALAVVGLVARRRARTPKTPTPEGAGVITGE